MFRLYTDGASQGNPGPAAVGILLCEGDRVVEEHSERIEDTTNNVAEYRALIRGLEVASEHTDGPLECYSDSTLMVNQVNRNWKIKNRRLAELAAEVWELENRFAKVTFANVPRDNEHVTEADRLAGRELRLSHVFEGKTHRVRCFCGGTVVFDDCDEDMVTAVCECGRIWTVRRGRTDSDS